MKTSPAFAEHCLDLFAGIGLVVARAMFGGYGFYVGPAMFAIGDAEEWRVWLKVDAATRARFEESGGAPFVYASRNGRTTAMSFFTVPDGAMEDAEAMLPWARLALQAAERAAQVRAAARKGGRRTRPPVRRRSRRES